MKKKSLNFYLNFFELLASFFCTWNQNCILNTVLVLETPNEYGSDRFQFGFRLRNPGSKAQLLNVTFKCWDSLFVVAFLFISNMTEFLYSAVLVPDHEKPGSRCRLSKVHNWPVVLGIWNGEGMGRWRSVQERPGAKVDRIASRQRRVSK
jgi:hypothetical protein